MTATVTRFPTPVVTFLRNVNNGWVTYAPNTGESWLTIPGHPTPTEVTVMADQVDAMVPRLVDAPRDAAGRWWLTGDGLRALISTGGRA